VHQQNTNQVDTLYPAKMPIQKKIAVKEDYYSFGGNFAQVSTN